MNAWNLSQINTNICFSINSTKNQLIFSDFQKNVLLQTSYALF